jgi:hypothetical protein
MNVNKVKDIIPNLPSKQLKITVKKSELKTIP